MRKFSSLTFSKDHLRADKINTMFSQVALENWAHYDLIKRKIVWIWNIFMRKLEIYSWRFKNWCFCIDYYWGVLQPLHDYRMSRHILQVKQEFQNKNAN